MSAAYYRKKLLEKIILSTLPECAESEGRLSAMHFRFCKGKSMVNAIQEVVAGMSGRHPRNSGVVTDSVPW